MDIFDCAGLGCTMDHVDLLNMALVHQAIERERLDARVREMSKAETPAPKVDDDFELPEPALDDLAF